MTPRKIAFLGLILCVSLAGINAAPSGQVVLYRAEFPQGIDPYRFALEHRWLVYDASGTTLILGRDVSKESGFPGTAAKIFEGDPSSVRWVTVRRGADHVLVSSRALARSGDRYLVRSADIPAAVASRPESYWVKPFRADPLARAADSVIVNPNLSYNPAVAAIVNQVDSARVKAWVTTMQNFGTRHVSAGNHATVTAWVKAQFTDMGIADVRTDTCYGTTGHNVIANLPGLYDTATVYITGGHYDSYSTSNAPGADDNASGAVAALEFAKILSQPGNRPNNTVRFMAFDAEELGLYGSTYCSARLRSTGATVGCMLNFDMCGADGNDSLFYSQQYAGSTAYALLLIKMARLYGRFADTNAVGQFGTSYLGQSDSYPFSQDGFPVAWVMERNESSVYHTANDDISHMNFRYYAGNLRGALGFFATLAFHPAMVGGVTVVENGEGHSLALGWKRDQAANISGYKVYWSRTSGNYVDWHTVTGSADTVDTIAGLTADSLYYVAVVAVNDQGQESVLLDEFRARPFNGVATTAFFDDFETGLGKWTRGHSGGTVDWDTTSATYHGPGHSITDSRAGNYGNNVNSYLQVLNGINLAGYNHASLSWWERYSTESGWDYCYPEISLNDGTTWDSTFIPKYSGSMTGWAQKSVDLTSLIPSASNFKFRFRFRSDVSQVDDGWYVDDVLLTGYAPAGVAYAPSIPSASGGIRLQCWPSPASVAVRVRYLLTAGTRVKLVVYDIAGRRVATVVNRDQAAGTHGTAWDGRDQDGQRVASGIYLLRLEAGGTVLLGKVHIIH